MVENLRPCRTLGNHDTGLNDTRPKLRRDKFLELIY